MSLLDVARGLALEAHGDQKYGDHPYTKHLQDVAEIVKPYGKTAVIVAYLHDVVEDTKVTDAEIVELFGERIADHVKMLTDEQGKNRKERKERTNSKFAYSGSDVVYRIARIVKAADRLANVRFSIETKNSDKLGMYMNEYPAFRTAVHRLGECDLIWKELDTLLKWGSQYDATPAQQRFQRHTDAIINY